MGRTTFKDFQSLQTLADLARLLKFDLKKLSYILYKLQGGPNGQYTEFDIKKRSGGTRRISAPYTGLKAIQYKLAVALQDIYGQKACAWLCAGKDHTDKCSKSFPQEICI